MQCVQLDFSSPIWKILTDYLLLWGVFREIFPNWSERSWAINLRGGGGGAMGVLTVIFIHLFFSSVIQEILSDYPLHIFFLPLHTSRIWKIPCDWLSCGGWCVKNDFYFFSLHDLKYRDPLAYRLWCWKRFFWTDLNDYLRCVQIDDIKNPEWLAPDLGCSIWRLYEDPARLSCWARFVKGVVCFSGSTIGNIKPAQYLRSVNTKFGPSLVRRDQIKSDTRLNVKNRRVGLTE